MKRAALLLLPVLVLTGCSSSEPTFDELAAACLDLFAGHGVVVAEQRCADAMELITTDPTSDEAVKVYEVLVDHIESSR